MANSGEKLLYFLIGGFVGASVALLFAPKSGEATRQFLGNKYREGAEALGQKIEQGRDFVSETQQSLSQKMGETVDRGRDTLTRQKEQISSAIEAGRRAYYGEKEKLTEEESGGEES